MAKPFPLPVWDRRVGKLVMEWMGDDRPRTKAAREPRSPSGSSRTDHGKVHDYRLAAMAWLGLDVRDGCLRRRNGDGLVHGIRSRGAALGFAAYALRRSVYFP